MLYAIGDVHGRFDLLQNLHSKIMEHSKQFDEINTIVMLGDYVDRGPQSKEVIDFLMSKPFTEFKHIYLRGNHEDMLTKSIYSEEDMVIYDIYPKNIRAARDLFIGNGGGRTLLSFGATTEDILRLLETNEHLVEKFEPYKEFFMNLLPYYKANGYLFVHAGIIPGLPLEDQDPNVMLWIRERFLEDDIDHGFRVIHGHTTTTSRGWGIHLEVKPNRINIDTAAYKTNVLTAVCLDEAHERGPEILDTYGFINEINS